MPSERFQRERPAIGAACKAFIDDVLKPRFLPAIRPTEFNYPIDIFGKWHGPHFRFIQRYRSGFPDNVGEEFDVPFVRLEYAAPGYFHISFYRHTGRWQLLYPHVSLAEALELRRDDGLLQPR